MKAMANGVLNLSTLDGWWDEAWLPDNSLGWAIGSGEEYDDVEYQDFVESQTLYNILEKDLMPSLRSQSWFLSTSLGAEDEAGAQGARSGF